MKRYVIIGNGVAGVTAASEIRAADPEGQITIFSEEPEPFYYRVRLPEVLSGQVEANKVVIHPINWFRENQLELLLGETAVEVDLMAREVQGSQGSRIGYDALLLATGARSFIPPVPGADKAGVFALRSVADARSITARAGLIESVILIGGGLLGLEAGYGLSRLGLKIQVVEFFDRLLPRQMDPAGAARLQKILEGMGFSFYLGARAKEIIGTGEAEGLLLEDGQTLKSGLVLFSAGIRPNLDLAKAMGLDTDKGVTVDDHLRTSQDDVWAAGDLVEHRQRLYGIWPAAKDQGVVAGKNMAGDDVVYEGTVMSNSLKVVGVDLTSAGEIDADSEYEAAVYEDENAYRKIVLDQGRIIGFIFFGLTQGVKECQAAMEKRLDVSGFEGELADRSFDYSQLT